jgi:hypothetical protein
MFIIHMFNERSVKTMYSMNKIIKQNLKESKNLIVKKSLISNFLVPKSF